MVKSGPEAGMHFSADEIIGTLLFEDLLNV